ncbi:DUF1934 domain-containing protein [Amphibacillus sp. MSJ-3]|uniref:DUF1934 domain-containing protein n=1 Tax=Amphibacillus sp. MSJ-3 TaxID=2841505 RepID=UPI001C0F0EA5|nr:DUF1934 domain-containing protein [Amphibacillus sp. MSJ-3]MBU5594837.1 DUF1934 domain-containing protein [Amphibacillus sp. MSJ-3]
MRLGKFFVKIRLQTEIKDQHDRQQTELTTVGQLIQTERQAVIRFTEQMDDQPDVQTMVTVKPEQVNIKRSGGVEMNQQFKLARTTETIYRHQFGSIRMETLTEQIHFQPLLATENAELRIDYITILNGAEKREHKLLLKIEEDKS